MQRKNIIKVVLLGKQGSGKTGLFNRYANDVFSETKATIGCDYVQVQQGDLKVSIWDTAGAERFQSLTPIYCKGADIFIYVIDGSNPEAETYLFDAVEQIREALEVSTNAEVRVAINKCDGNVTPEIAQEFKRKIEERFAEEFPEKHVAVTIISAKNGTGVKKIFDVSGNEIQLLAEMRALSAELTKEIDSCWLFPNKQRKCQKRNFLKQVLLEYDNGKKSLSECFAAVEKITTPETMQAVMAGRISTRTATLFKKINPNFNVLRSQPTAQTALPEVKA